jgi:hypothetical protein
MNKRPWLADVAPAAGLIIGVILGSLALNFFGPLNLNAVAAQPRASETPKTVSGVISQR